MRKPSLIQRLRERKHVQWALAFLAGAFVVCQLLDALAEPLCLSPVIQRTILLVVVVGFFITLVIAWYYCEKGQRRMSGPELLIVSCLPVVAAFGVRMVWHGPADDEGGGPLEPHAEERSVAVLPLDNLRSTDEYAFFADAMTEWIRSALTEVPELTVESRNSAAKFVGSGLAVAKFARTLGVARVIEGTVQRSADRIRITVQLIDARRDEYVWAGTYERRVTCPHSRHQLLSHTFPFLALKVRPPERRQVQERRNPL
jgi:TolB-like protein